MNERIKELAEQAVDIVAKKRILPDGQIEKSWRPEYYDQVFAELIIKECAAAVAKANNPLGRNIDKVFEMHFGAK